MTKEDGGSLYHIPLAILGNILALKKEFYLTFAQAKYSRKRNSG